MCSNNAYNTFYENVISCGFAPKITLPTRICDTASTLIDNVYTNVLDKSLRAYLRGGGSNPPPKISDFFLKSEGRDRQKKKKKGNGGGRVGYFFTYFWGLIFFRVGLRYFQGG